MAVDPAVVGRGEPPPQLGVRLTGLWEAKRRGAAVVPSFAIRYDPDDPPALTLATTQEGSFIRCRAIDPNIAAPSAPYRAVRSVLSDGGDQASLAAALGHIVTGTAPIDLALTLVEHLGRSGGWRGVAVRRDGCPDAFVCNQGESIHTSAFHDHAGVLHLPRDYRRPLLVGRRSEPPWLWGARRLLDYAHWASPL